MTLLWDTFPSGIVTLDDHIVRGGNSTCQRTACHVLASRMDMCCDCREQWVCPELLRTEGLESKTEVLLELAVEAHPQLVE